MSLYKGTKKIANNSTPVSISNDISFHSVDFTDEITENGGVSR